MTQKALESMTIAVDFDGVLYQGPWTELRDLPHGPVAGAIDWLCWSLRAGHKIIIHTSRFARPEDYPDGAHFHDGSSPEEITSAIVQWIFKHCDGVDRSLVRTSIGLMLKFHTGAGKPHADLYIDDKGFRFNGKFPEQYELEQLRVTWRERPAELAPEPEPTPEELGLERVRSRMLDGIRSYDHEILKLSRQVEELTAARRHLHELIAVELSDMAAAGVAPRRSS